MSTYAGGDVAGIASGGEQLAAVAIHLHDAEPVLRSAPASAAGSAGDARLSASLGRFGAAWSAYAHAAHSQFVAASTLARNAAADLAVSGGH